MSNLRRSNASKWAFIQVVFWAVVVWFGNDMDCSVSSIVMGCVFPGMLPAMLGILADIKIVEHEEDMWRYKGHFRD